MQDIELLIFHDLQLAAVLQRVERRVAQQRDDGDEKLRPHDVHLLVPVRHIHDAVVVQLVVDLQQRHQHRVLAVLFAAVLVQLLEKIFIFVLRRGRVGLIFHLEHNGNKFSAALVRFAENEVPLAARARVVVLFNICIQGDDGNPLFGKKIDFIPDTEVVIGSQSDAVDFFRHQLFDGT